MYCYLKMARPGLERSPKLISARVGRDVVAFQAHESTRLLEP